jgi:hypothetical protein
MGKWINTIQYIFLKLYIIFYVVDYRSMQNIMSMD